MNVAVVHHRQKVAQLPDIQEGPTFRNDWRTGARFGIGQIASTNPWAIAEAYRSGCKRILDTAGVIDVTMSRYKHPVAAPGYRL